MYATKEATTPTLPSRPSWRFRLVSAAGSPIRFNILFWYPCFFLYLWVQRIVLLNTTFDDSRQKLLALCFLLAQSLLAALLVLIIDSAVTKIGPRYLRIAIASVVHILCASLLLDCLLYKAMRIHLPTGLRLLFSDGVSNLRINLHATGINVNALEKGLAAGFISALLIVFYCAWMIRHSAAKAKRFSVGSVLLFAFSAFLCCQVIERAVAHHYKWNLAFDELRSAMPFYVGPPHPIRGLVLENAHLRPYQQNQTTMDLALAQHATLKSNPDIFIFVLEGTRGDYITEQIAPNLTHFRSEAIKFADSISSGNGTHISWYSILTGNLGIYFGMEKKTTHHCGSIPIALLRQAGYKINVLCASSLKFYDMDRLVFGDKLQLCDGLLNAASDLMAPDKPAPTRDLQVYEQTMKALDQPAGGRLFLIFNDATHYPYLWPTNETPRFTPYATKYEDKIPNVDRKDIDLVANRYRNSLFFTDKLMGQLFEKLKATHQYDNCVIAITGDHGEEFLDHGSLIHGSNLYRPQTHVPFYLKLPLGSVIPQNIKDQPPLASHVDLLPTILDYVGIAPPMGIDGRSIFRAKEDAVFTVAQNGSRDPFSFCIQTQNYKAFLRYKTDNTLIALEDKLYLTSITDTHDKVVDLNLSSAEGRLFVKTNFGNALLSLYPGLKL